MHWGTTLAFGGGADQHDFNPPSLSLIISEFINTHLIPTLRRDFNHLHTK